MGGEVQLGCSTRLASGLLGLISRLFALAMIVVLSPVLLVVAIVICSSSRGPAVFRQVRIGQYGRPFTIYKFRTMHDGADRRLAEVLAADGTGEIVPFFKVKGDPRVTNVGRFLRHTSVDELPQLLNVLLGHMSLVGPRPQSPAEVATYDARSWRRLLVRPGVTGLWQVSGRNTMTSEQGLECDLVYVRDWTPGLDLKVLARTPMAVLAQRGAY